ncbi:MAG: Na/Pi symporter [Bacteroidaceae bacterium]|nr:Na/Pi symporter [Bacteroidaceae bacterium]
MEGTFFIVFRLLGSLALLIFGMKRMSEALQKLAGPQLRHVLGRMTTNRFTGMLTGVLVTAAVQSSTATTVMTVSFVNAGLLTLAQAISVIMGANIGTTLTAWIMSAGMAGSSVSFSITDLVWPTFVVAMFLIYRKRHETVGDFLFGLAFLFLGLGTLRQTGTDMNLGENPAVLAFFSSFDPNSFTTTLLFLLIGGVLTMCVQSSAAIMAITMILCSSGALPIYQGIALVMGENIGTTVTSNLAALSASTQARRAAFAHMFFNLFGVCWILLVFHPFVDFVCALAGYDGSNPERLTLVLATFHTCFNVANTALLIGFVPQIERIVRWVIKDRLTPEEQPVRLQYIEVGFLRTPEILVFQAQKEMALFADRMQRMFGMVTMLCAEEEGKEQEKLFSRIEKYEDIADNMENEIAHYLEQVSDGHLSDETKAKIRGMLREVGELESIGDSCSKLARILRRNQSSKKAFTPEQKVQLHEMMKLVGDALMQMCLVMSGRRKDYSLDETLRIEGDINQLRDRLRQETVQTLDGEDYLAHTMFLDLVNECERLGDYVVNVVEARLAGNGLVLDSERKTVVIDGEHVSLTRTEFDVLRLLYENPGQVFSRQQLIEKAWPADVVITDRTVDVCIARLRKKIGNYASCIVARQGLGYCFQRAASES